jgi:DNA-binding beta-propeller fold protein YncE
VSLDLHDHVVVGLGMTPDTVPGDSPRESRDGRFRDPFGGLRFEDFDGVFDPTMVAVPDTGEIVVYGHAVYTFTPQGQRLDARRIPMRTEVRCQIAVDAAGSLYVVEAPNHRVHKLDREGRILQSFGGGYGEEPGQVFDPIGLTVDAAGRVWLADWFRGQGRVHGFTPDGGHLGTWSVGDDGQRLRRPEGIAVDLHGWIVVTDRNLPNLVTITLGTAQ